MASAKYFRTPQAFRRWLQTHHARSDELLVGFRKRAADDPGISWPQAVDEALCFGWIDGVRKRIDDERYSVRFTPRRPGSRWSAVNIRRVAELEALGRMTAAGRAAVEQRSAARSRTYSYEREQAAALDAPLEARLRKDRKASAFFESLPPSYRRKVLHWIQGAKQEATRRERLERALTAFRAGKRL
jgi:uncharacterized protein YdeI (YjbR/CyaY-like superfamily)